jgi:CubicO group peptidase (beta-lactamase class C family)
MKTQIFLLLVLLTVSVLSGCSNNTGKSNDSIEGLWVSTEETSWKFLSGTQKATLYIIQNQNGAFTVRGVFLWNDDYSSEWKLTDIDYNNLTRGIIVKDTVGNTYRGMVDIAKNKITGALHLKNNEIDSLNFIQGTKDLEIALFHPRIPGKNDDAIYSYKKPEELNDFLQTTSILELGIDTSLINHLVIDIINQKYGRIESLLIVKDNKLILEEYFYGYEKTRLHKIYSCTKSITSLLLGIALDRHPDIKIDQSIFSFLPEYDSLKTKDKENITLKHILTMSAGLEWNEYPKEMYEMDDRIGYVLSRPMNAKPGEKFHYNSGYTAIIGYIVHTLEGKNAEEFADKLLFQPLGITKYIWKTHKNGNLEFWNGLQMLPRDMAKIGLLVQNDGKWNDNQLVSKEWIDESTRPYIAESKFFNYSYHWWIRSKDNESWWNDTNPEKDNNYDIIIALSWGGNYIMIVKELNLVVVTTASNFDNGSALDAFPLVIERIIPAVSNII